jgi:hypothetical protein
MPRRGPETSQDQARWTPLTLGAFGQRAMVQEAGRRLATAVLAVSYGGLPIGLRYQSKNDEIFK